MRLHFFFGSVTLASLLVSAAPAQEPSYPNRPIHVLYAFPPGSSTEEVVRRVCAPLGQTIGQPVVIENRSGGGGTLAAEYVAKAAPDGYTILAGSSAMSTFNVVYPSLSFDVQRDLSPITLAEIGMLMVYVNSNLPAGSLKEFIAYAKQNPGKLNYGSTGIGSTPHLFGEQLKSLTDVSVVHVPYRGGAELVKAMLQNEIQMTFLPVSPTLYSVLAGSGKAKAIAVTGPTRSTLYPELPTAAGDTGLPGLEMTFWQGYFGPAKLPQLVRDKLYRATAAVVKSPEIREYIIKSGAEPGGQSPEEFTKYFGTQIVALTKVIRDNNIKSE